MNTNLYFCISENESLEKIVISFVVSILEESEVESVKQQLLGDIDDNNLYDYIFTCCQFLPNLVKSKNASEIQSFITILSDIVSNVEAEKLLDAENELCASICAEGLFEPNDRMKLLNILYNSAADYSNEKILILKHMITSCDGYEEVLFKFIMSINIDEWKIENNLYRSLLIALYTRLDTIQKPELSRQVLIKYLLSFENGRSEYSEAIPYAVNAVLYCLQYITPVNDYNELDLEAIKMLQDNEEYKDLYSLLLCIKSGDLDHFEEIYNKSLRFLKDKNIDKELLLSSTRLSLLLTLLNKRTTIEFSEIATALHISEEEVESWIIKGFKNKLIEGKINQVNKTFTITRCNCLDFTKENWELLHSKLSVWKESIDMALDSIKSIKH